MRFFDDLVVSTAAARAHLLSTPIVQDCLRGVVQRPAYMAFLHEAYHHVRHTVPLLQACRAAIPARLGWLRPALDEYIDEETGHDQWILDDIAAAGGDPALTRYGRPALATEVMVAYAYDAIARGNPVSFFGMVHVLEGTSVALALRAADQIQRALALPEQALTYLRSHGELDKEHTSHFELLMDGLTEARDQREVIHRARAFYHLYAGVFNSLPVGNVQAKEQIHEA